MNVTYFFKSIAPLLLTEHVRATSIFSSNSEILVKFESSWDIFNPSCLIFLRIKSYPRKTTTAQSRKNHGNGQVYGHFLINFSSKFGRFVIELNCVLRRFCWTFTLKTWSKILEFFTIFIKIIRNFKTTIFSKNPNFQNTCLRDFFSKIALHCLV